jgi:hypothetical protein
VVRAGAWHSGEVLIRCCAVVLGLVLVASCGKPRLAVQDDPNPPAPKTSAAAPEVHSVPGDLGPHEVENNSSKYPKDVSPEDRQAATEVTEKIRPQLEALRAGGDFSLESTKKVLSGYQDVGVQKMNDPDYLGAVFGFHVGKTGCVQGAVRPDGVTVMVTGLVAEWGCNPVGATH